MIHGKGSAVKSRMASGVVAFFLVTLALGLLMFATGVEEIASPTFEYICPTPTEEPIQRFSPPDVVPNKRFIINFGDSYSRTGFDHLLTGPDSPDSNPRPENPLGNPAFPGETSTGGVNWLGYMATEFNETTTLVYNFAASGAVTDKKTCPTRLDEYTDLTMQVERFAHTIGSRPAYANWTAENSVASIWMGINDLGVSWRWGNLSVVLPQLTNRLVGQAQVLHDMGLRNFLFVEVPELDLLPMYFKAKKDPTQRRPVVARYFCTYFNVNLRKQVEKFQAANPDSRVSIISTGDIFTDAVMNPKAFGAADHECIDRGGEKCLWWDGSHPSKSMHKVIAKRASKAAWGRSEYLFEG